MKGNKRIVEFLNELLTLELTVVNQYFAHSKMCAAWGYGRLAGKLREDAMAEMRDAEEIIDRILFFEGLPNLQRLGSVSLGEAVPEVLKLAVASEGNALKLLAEGITICAEEADIATREFLAGRLAEEETHLDWLETQLRLIEQIGETNYLAQQVRD
jgi:bacterioferritin